jgi:hypothetical protein
MNYTLNDILEGVVVIPYDEATINIIDEACHSYDAENKFEAMDEMIDSFLNSNVSSSFARHINDALANNHTITKLPCYILQRVALYKACIIIDDADNDLERSILSTILMNFMILYKNDFESLALPKVIHSFYQYHIAKYIADNDIIITNSMPNIICKIADSDFTISNIKEADEEALRIMAKESFLYSTEHLLSTDNNGIELDPFIKGSVALKNFTQNSVYLYYNIPITTILFLIFKENGVIKKKKRLNSIIEMIKPYIQDKNTALHTKSSIILRLVNEETVIGASSILNKTFSLEEFASYIYYELLIECIIKKFDE